MKYGSVLTDLSLAESKVQYDEHVKSVLGNKAILAWILKETAEEYSAYTAREIEGFIESDISISGVAVNPGAEDLLGQRRKEDQENPRRTGGFTGDRASNPRRTDGFIGDRTSNPRITGTDTQDKVPNEGWIVYDIRFHASVPDKDGRKRIKLLFNVEAQKDFYHSYENVTRGIFYGARMISAQLGREFEPPHYEDIKKVYSIWICMNVPGYLGNVLSVYSIGKQDIEGTLLSDRENYDKLSVVMICLNGKNETDQSKLHRLLNVLLSPELGAAEKGKILEKEFGIEAQPEWREEMEEMCNLSEVIEERGIKQGIEQGIKALVLDNLEDGKTEEQIIQKLIKRFCLTEEEARKFIMSV